MTTSKRDPESEYDQETYVERTDVGVSITTKLKRGTDTRDQDEHIIKAKGETLTDATDKHYGALHYLETNVLDDVRNMQPETEGDDA